MTPKRKKQMIKRRQAKHTPKRKETKLEYETRIKQEKGLQFMGYLKMPIDYINFRDLANRSEYFGDWNPDMPSMARDKVRTYHVTLHLAPLIHLGGETKNGFEGGTMVKTMTCLPSQVYEETRKLMQIVRLEHEVEVSEFYSYAVLRS